MKLSELPVNTVVTIGLPRPLRAAVKYEMGRWEGNWRWIDTGQKVDMDDFKGGWDFPAEEPVWDMPESVRP